LARSPGHALLSNLQWSRVFATGEVLFIACFAMFAWRYRQVLTEAPAAQAGWLPRAVAAYAAVGAAVLLLAPAVPGVETAIALLSAYGIGLTLWTQFSLSQAAWRLRRTEPVAIALAGVLYLVLLAHDATIITDRTEQSLVFLRPYAVLPLFLAVGWLLTRRYLDALHEAQRLSTRLAQEVAQQRQQLVHNFEQLRQAELQQEREQAQQQERTRLTRELHDGLGLHLLSALQQARQPNADVQLLATTLQDCLDDLRVAVDSLAEDERDPVAVLGSLRYRMAPRLAAAGIELRWEVDNEVPELSWLDPPRVLHLLRIVQEALSNAMRHSGASVVTMSVRRAPDAVEVRVQDNGRGFAAFADADAATRKSTRPGRGLSHMRGRAGVLRAQLSIEGGPAGTLLSLRLPLALPAAPSALNPA
jgi:signal transduction histidine kinase